ncbi:LLM class flavin-dependent oxidoreductase [Loktanella sp. Alg231-35]|uniref:LLM class flavin-dependent oxidoreductase n=1 Tax=Loktanella sp. Alg231-35 TaxID=1922220 RepID=UPI000D5592D7|nr:LLM class flavin-dependent oxidoreductase [Loktanella sp. Alg231-35]
MKFHLAINLERMNDTTSMTEVRDHTIEMVKMADRAGFEIVWAAEHHALEMTIAPNPFQLMTWWADHTENIGVGCGVANAAYWHPIKLAGEAALVDVLSGGRLELGLGSGAYQREFDRMHPGLAQKDSHHFMQEMLPLVRELWKGDVEHNGEKWQFPKSTSCPKPLQDKVPMWVAARSPITFDYAVANDCNVMCWPLTMPMSEAEKYKGQLDDSIAKAGGWDGTFALMRHTAVYDNEDDRTRVLSAVRSALGRFGNLMMKKGDVINGFPEVVPLEELEGNVRVDPAMLEENLALGSPEQVIAKLKAYEALGVDAFIYYASMGLDMETQKRSMTLFINEVMPEFA